MRFLTFNIKEIHLRMQIVIFLNLTYFIVFSVYSPDLFHMATDSLNYAGQMVLVARQVNSYNEILIQIIFHIIFIPLIIYGILEYYLYSKPAFYKAELEIIRSFLRILLVNLFLIIPILIIIYLWFYHYIMLGQVTLSDRFETAHTFYDVEHIVLHFFEVARTSLQVLAVINIILYSILTATNIEVRQFVIYYQVHAYMVLVFGSYLIYALATDIFSFYNISICAIIQVELISLSILIAKKAFPSERGKNKFK